VDVSTLFNIDERPYIPFAGNLPFRPASALPT
jgi:hypothetical protein